MSVRVLDLEVRTVVNCSVGAGNWNQSSEEQLMLLNMEPTLQSQKLDLKILRERFLTQFICVALEPVLELYVDQADLKQRSTCLCFQVLGWIKRVYHHCPARN